MLRRSVLATCLLFPLVDQSIKENLLAYDDNPHYGKVSLQIYNVLKKVNISSYVQFPKRLRASIDFIINAQYRLTPLHPKRKFKHGRFLAQSEMSSALSFLSLRAKNNEDTMQKYSYWQQSYLTKKNASDETND